MAKISITLYSKLNRKGMTKVMISVAHNKSVAQLTTGVEVFPDEWKGGKVVCRKDEKQLNGIIQSYYSIMQSNLASLRLSTDISRLSATELRDMLSPHYDAETAREKKARRNSFISVYDEYNQTHANPKTRDMYDRTMKAMSEFDAELDKRTFDDIDGAWLNRFKSSRSGRESPNTITMHLTHIRAVFNYAIYDLEITHAYPFRKKHGTNRVVLDQTDAKVQPMPLEHLREIWSMAGEPWQEKWIDLAKLVFLLIGINMADLSELSEVDQFGYITYRRKKTRDRSRNGAAHRVKVEPEAMEIIERWRGRDHLLSHFDDRSDYASASKQMVHAVKCLGIESPACVGGHGIRAEVSRRKKSEVSTASRYGYFCLYSLRKAWATIAFNYCHIPMEIISMALGHSDGMGLSVTQRYVQMNNTLVDEANRKVIDFVLYNKNGEVL